MDVKLFITSSNTYEPIVYDGITWSTQRIGEPGKLVFTCIKDNNISFSEGAPVRLSVDGKDVFFGFVFEKSRDKNHHIEVTCYDQLRYLKNKDTYVYKNKTASELIKMIASDFNLKVGEIEDTGFKIAQRVEDNKTLFDIIYTALDLTLINTGKLYVLYDDFGKITLKNIESMQLKTVVNDEVAENFNYKSSIDGDTFNQIKIVRKTETDGKFEVFITKDSEHQNQWGILQYYEVVDKGANAKSIADNLIDRRKGKNRKTRSLDIDNMIGDVSVRAGCSLPVYLNLGDIITSNNLVVESCTHTFSENNHRMNLHLIGGLGFV